MAEDRSEIAFFDVETTVPTKAGQGFAILEFGAILVCPRKLTELDNYATLLRPKDLSLISPKSQRCNGISRDDVAAAPSFSEVADKVFDLLHGRIWAGHNILRFDCPRIREAFAEIGRPAPEPKGTIDSLALLTKRFGRRAGNMKMANLATYFGLGQQTHRSLDDVRMNLEVLKYCATVLFLESSVPDILASNTCVSPRKSGGRVLPDQMSGTFTLETPVDHTLVAKILDLVEPAKSETDSFNMRNLSKEIMACATQVDNLQEDRPILESPEISHNPSSDDCRSSSVFLTPEDVSMHSIKASLIRFCRGYQRIQVLHKDVVLKLLCTRLKVQFGVSTKFLDKAGRPRLSFVVIAPGNLCQVLDACDSHVQKLFMQSGSTSDWRPLVSRRDGYWNFPTVRLNIHTVLTVDDVKYGVELSEIEAASGEQKLLFSKMDGAELESLLTPGTFIDAFFSLEPYDYMQNAGIRLVAKKLVIHSK